MKSKRNPKDVMKSKRNPPPDADISTNNLYESRGMKIKGNHENAGRPM